MTFITITTGSRLHFGLLDVRAPFGGCGVMIQSPSTRVVVRKADRFHCDPEHSPRIEAIAQRWSTHFGNHALPPVAITVETFSAAHCGFGSGTQLSMAIAEGLLSLLSPSDGVQSIPRERIIRLAGRGMRSMVGTYGYFEGGFIAEGLAPLSTPSPSLPASPDRQLTLPPNWHVVVIVPKAHAAMETVSGSRENDFFDRLPMVSHATRARLVDIVTADLADAIVDSDFERFVDGIEAFNRASGELFAAVQGGPYRSPSTHWIERARALGGRGFGQSSWGPGVFAWFETEQQAADFAKNWTEPLSEAVITRPTGGRSVLPS